MTHPFTYFLPGRTAKAFSNKARVFGLIISLICPVVRVVANDVEPDSQAPEAVVASVTNSVDSPALQTFELIIKRNIFDPNRRAPRAKSERPVEKVHVPVVDTIALTGIMTYSKGTFAFFDGSSSMYREAVEVGDAFAGYSVKSISDKQVELEKEDQRLELKIGEQLRREDAGEWKIASNADFTPTSSKEKAPSNDSPPGTDSSQSSNEPSDALKRLLEKRKNELSK
jgi:hypothetical protein